MKLLAIGAAGHFLVNLATTTMFTGVSYYNYPGGVALHNLHQLIPLNKGKYRHLSQVSFLFAYFGSSISFTDNQIGLYLYDINISISHATDH